MTATGFFVNGEHFRALRPAPHNQYSQFDRIDGLLPAGVPIVHATGRRLRSVLWRILGPSNRLSLQVQSREGSWNNIQRLPHKSENTRLGEP